MTGGQFEARASEVERGLAGYLHTWQISIGGGGGVAVGWGRGVGEEGCRRGSAWEEMEEEDWRSGRKSTFGWEEKHEGGGACSMLIQTWKKMRNRRGGGWRRRSKTRRRS